jgi:NitT/TauT family transport system substrate-binding protein
VIRRFRTVLHSGVRALTLAAVLLIASLGAARAANERAVLVLSQPTLVPVMAYAFVAQQMGYWTEEGVDVDIQFSAGTAQTIQLLAAGKADIGQSSEIQLMQAREKGVALKVVMTLVREFGSKLAVPIDSPVRTIGQLRGQKIGVASTSAAQIPFVRAMVASGGLNPDTDVDIVPVGFGAAPIASLRSGQIAAVAFWGNQFATWEIAGQQFRYFPATFFPDDMPGYNFVALERTVSERRNVVVGVLRGMAKGLLFSETNPEAALELYYRANPTKRPVGDDAKKKRTDDLELIKHEITVTTFRGRRIEKWGANYKPGWEAARDFYLAQGVLRVKRDVEEYYVPVAITDEINRFDAATVIRNATTFR